MRLCEGVCHSGWWGVDRQGKVNVCQRLLNKYKEQVKVAALQCTAAVGGTGCWCWLPSRPRDPQHATTSPAAVYKPVSLCVQAASEANHANKARMQWLEQELEVQAQKAARTEAALQDRAAMEDRIQLLQVGPESVPLRGFSSTLALALHHGSAVQCCRAAVYCAVYRTRVCREEEAVCI